MTLLQQLHARVRPRRISYSAATAHAPRGGANVAGKHFAGGEFIPGKVMAKATPAERAKVEGRAPATESAAPSGRSQLRLVGGDAKAPVQPQPKREKIRATAGEMSEAMRVGTGKEARIVLADGSPAPAHIRPSMVPPDWTDVRVSVEPHAEVLVKARDKAGRIKTVYSDNFTMKTAAAKFARVREMLEKSDAIHAQNQANRRSPDPAIRDAADLTWLIQEQATRPGSNTDTRAKVKAYGATTLRAEHVVEAPDGVRLQFIGKEGVAHDHLIRNPELARMLLERRRTAGSRGGQLFATDEKKLNRYIATLDGGSFSAKDFRTLKATKLAIEHIRAIGECCSSVKDYKAKVKEVAEKVSHVLGNKPAQALESYINPTVFSVWRNPANG